MKTYITSFIVFTVIACGFIAYATNPKHTLNTELGVIITTGDVRIISDYACLTDVQNTIATVEAIEQWELTHQEWTITVDHDGTSWVMAKGQDTSLNEWLWFTGHAKSTCWTH